MPDGAGNPDRMKPQTATGRPRRRRSMGAMALEPRVMYDAAAVATVGAVTATAADPTHTADTTVTSSPTAAAAPATDASHTTDASSTTSATQSGASVLGLAPAATGTAPATDSSSGQQVVFIDPHVPDYQLLAAGVKPGEQVVILDPNTDGVQQIANWLASHNEQNVDAIHIVSHGEDGTVRLGSTILAANDVNQFAQPLAEIGAALKPGGDILFYGCDVGQGAVGDMFMVEMSMATGGAHIAAASHLVGAADLGGSWNLNVQLGSIDVGNPFTAPTLAAFNDILTNQIWFTTNSTSSSDPGTRIETVGANGTGATDVVDATQPSGSALDTMSGIVVDAARGVYFVANLDANGNNAIYEGSIATGALNATPIYVGPAFTFDATTFRTNNAYISGLQLDAQNGQLYFAQGVVDTSTGKNLSSETGIFRISENGTGLTQVVSFPSTSLDAPRNFALDFQDNLVFFTDQAGQGSKVDSLGVANLSTGAVTFLGASQLTALGVTTNNGLLSGVAVDPAHGMLYFTSMDPTSHQNHNYIFSAPFTVSGSGATAAAALGTINTLYTVGSTGAPASIVLDVPDGLFFVANATDNPDSSTPVGGSIEVGQLAGSSAGPLTTILETSAMPGVTHATKPANLFFESAPTVTAGGGVMYNLNGGPVVVDAGATAADSTGQDLASATVTISSGFLAGDTLTANTTGTAIAASYNSATGMLTLTGADTAAHYQQVLDSIAFSSANANPSNSGLDAQRTLTWAVSDGVLTSAPATSTVSMTPPPALAGSAASTFVGGGAAVALDGGITATDAGGTLAGATISISNGFLAGDTLAFTDQSGIHGSYNAATGILTLSGTASVANYQAALESITYSFAPGNGDPTGGGSNISRTVSWVVTDGAANSNVLTSTLNTVHVAPSVVAGGTATFSGGGAPVTLDGALTVSDVDSNGNLAGATVSIGSGFVAGDSLNFTNQNGITGSYNAATGVLTLSGTASVANYQAALESVTYGFAPGNGDPTAGGGNTARAISWSVTDGVASASGASALNAVHVPPTVVAGGTATFTGGGAPVTLDGALAVSDVDSNGNLAGATVSIGSGFVAGDSLNFTNQNGITGSYNAATGVLTLTGTATVANYQAALESVTYGFTPGNGDPTAGGGNTARAISWSVTDGVASASGASALNTVHVPPTVVAGGTATFTGGGAPVTLDGALTVSDVDSNGNLTGATVSISSGFVAGDTLAFANQNGITGSYNAATGVLTLSGTSSVANYQAALESITYGFTPANGDPTAGGGNTARAISWSVTDGVASASDVSALNTVHVAPGVVAGGTATFTGGGAPVTLDGALTVSDVDSNGNLTGATVAIGSGFIAGDTLGLTNQGGVTGSYNAATGVLTLSGTASVANYQAALDSITYSFNPINGDPTGGGGNTARTITWTVNDGASSSAATSALNTVHVAPSVVPDGTAVFTGGGPAVTLDSGLTVNDVDSNGTLAGATVSIGSGFIAGDTLNFGAQNGITGSYNASSGVLTLTGTASLASYQAALNSITYSFSPGNGDPTGGGANTARTINWVVNDGVANSSTATTTLDTVHVAPTVVAGGSATFTGGGAPVTLDGALTVGDVDSNGNLSGATVAISSGFIAGDTLGFTDQSGIHGSYNAATGVLTLSGTASVANYQAALESITYGTTPGNGDPTGGGGDTSRTISWSVADGVANSTTVTSALNTVHVAPTVVAGGSATFTGGGAPVTLDGALTVGDVDSNGNLTGATVAISSGFLAGDTLGFANQNGITGSYNAATGVLTLSGKASVANYQAALESITYGFTTGGDPTQGGDTSRQISWSVTDGVASSGPATSSLSTVNATHVAPTLSGAGNTQLYTKHGPPVTIDSALTVSDPDSGGTLVGATVTISAGLRSGDTLAAVTTATGITASYNANTGVLTLTGTDTIAHYQSVLDSVTYSSTNPNPSFGNHDKTRTITWVVNDGATSHNLSTPVTSTIDDPTSLVAANHLTQDGRAPALEAPKLTLPAISNDTELVTDVTSASSLGADPDNGSEPIWLQSADHGRVVVQQAALTTEPYAIEGEHAVVDRPLWLPARPGDAPADSGKPGLLAQLKAAGRQGLVNERQTLLKSLHHRPTAR
jgi:hypothetical protein